MPTDPAEDKLADFVKVVLGETEDVWTELFRKMNKEYKNRRWCSSRTEFDRRAAMRARPSGPSTARLIKRSTSTSAFYQELKDKFKAPGEFAEAYVIAHEIGHHVQNLLGISDKVHAQQSRGSKEEGQRIVGPTRAPGRFLAGVWAHHLHKERQNPRSRRRREWPPRRLRDRRRPPPAGGPGIRGARLIHARNVKAARPLVQKGTADRRHQTGRHVQRGRFVMRSLTGIVLVSADTRPHRDSPVRRIAWQAFGYLQFDPTRYTQMSAIIDVEGIGEVYAEKLKEAGIATTEVLLKETPHRRVARIEKATGIGHALILRWINHVDLFRIKGVQKQYAELSRHPGSTRTSS